MAAERGGSLMVAELDAIPRAEAGALLEGCCGSKEWVRRMLARRPFGSSEALLATAADVWRSLAPDDWLEAFSRHPRIGERDAATLQDAQSAWSGEEQRRVEDAGEALRAELARGNREYERKFGHIYLVSARGRSAGELLAILIARLSNDAATELRVAAAEQAKITELRLTRLVRLAGVDEEVKRER